MSVVPADEAHSSSSRHSLPVLRRDHPNLSRIALLAAGLAPPALYFLFVAHYGVNFIYWDEWAVVPLINAELHGSLTFTMLWAQHNENRMLLPNVLFVLSGRFGSTWQSTRPMLVEALDHFPYCSQAAYGLALRTLRMLCGDFNLHGSSSSSF